MQSWLSVRGNTVSRAFVKPVRLSWHLTPGTCVSGDAFPRSRENFDTGNMCQRRRVPSKPGAISTPGTCVGGDAFPRSREQFPKRDSGAKKTSRRVSLADSFLRTRFFRGTIHCSVPPCSRKTRENQTYVGMANFNFLRGNFLRGNNTGRR